MAARDTSPYLTDEEIKTFLDDLDHNKDGIISYAEVEAKLDAAHDELAPQPGGHNTLHRKSKTRSSETDKLRHSFLRSIIGSNEQQIKRDDFALRVKEWKIPSIQHAKKQQAAERAYVRKLSYWRRFRAFWAVHGPEVAFLGLVLAVQLAFAIWQLVKYLSTPPYRSAFGWGVVLAKTSAGALYPTVFLLILSMSRYFATVLRFNYHISRFINWDLSQSFHIKMSIATLFLATLHVIGHLAGTFYSGSRERNQESVAKVVGENATPVDYGYFISTRPGWTGLTAFSLFWILAGLSLPQVRKWNYEVFQLGHLLMFPIISMLMAHGTAAIVQFPMLGYWLAFPTLLVMVERIVRVFMGFHRIPATLKVLDSETVEVKATIPSERFWKYRAGQYVFLQVPKISFFQWHPFTVSVCRGKEVILHIKTDGNWTGRLRELGGEAGSANIEIGINGPFGAPAQRFYDFSQSIIIGAGIGVTPFSGILADLQARDDAEHAVPDGDPNTKKGSIPHPHNDPLPGEKATSPPPDDYHRVDFHWMVRDRNYLLWHSELLNTVTRAQARHAEDDDWPHLDIRIKTHVTSKKPNIVTHVYRWLLEMHRTDAHPASPLTGLLNATEFGRPDLEEILHQHYEDMVKLRATQNSDEELKVGVFFCGAPVIGEILADQCSILSARGRADDTKIEYHFMIEVFG